jgi:diacylglycerol kinase family enzyme
MDRGGMRATLLHNSTAGDDPARADELVAALRSAGVDAAYVPVHAGEIPLPDDLGDVVVVAGGDGTVCRVAKRLAGLGVPLAILPVGTANNVARALGQVGAVQHLAAGWLGGRRAPLDMGVVRGVRGEERFLEAFGVGAFAAMIAAGHGRPEPDRAGFAGNRIDRGLLMLREALATSPCRRLRVRLDRDELEGEYLFVEAMNIPTLGPNLPLAPGADPTDGALDVVFASAEDRAQLLEHVDGRLHGVAAWPSLAVRRTRTIDPRPSRRTAPARWRSRSIAARSR